MGLGIIGLNTMQINEHEAEVIAKLQGAGWLSQHDLKTSRQTLNKLVRGKLVERTVGHERIKYLPETSARYRLINNVQEGAK